MPKPKGVAAPFFFAVHAPSRRPDALLAQAVRDLGARRFADALVASEAVCRSMPRVPVPAVLRARILEACRPTFAPPAWVNAWGRDPLDPMLQDAMLESWLRAGVASRVAEQGATFLPSRCRAETQEALLALLGRAGLERAGACWSDGEALQVRCFATTGAPLASRVVVSTESADTVHETDENGALCLPFGPGACIDRVAFENGPALAGAPVVFASAHEAPSPATIEPGVDIIVPVYRDARGVQDCLRSVLQSLPRNRTSARVVVVNDASPEPELVVWLEGLAASGRVTVLHNRFNLGFIETVNRALRRGRSDALLLNADTLVHGDWIDRLYAALEASPDVASVMPWSNNGEIGNLDPNGAAEAPGAAQLALIDSAAAQLRAQGRTADAEVPTTIGFAMLMRRRAMDAVGMLDAAGLARGYLEEVDWCLRARAAGWRHLIATGVFVAHKGSASFRVEKQLRVRQNAAVIEARYPDHSGEYLDFLLHDPLVEHRRALLDAVQQKGVAWPPKARPRRERIDVQAALPGGVARVGVWRLRAASPEAAKILAVARALAGCANSQAPRLLVFGDADECLRHTGVVDVVAHATRLDEVLPDAALASLAGCAELLAPASADVPDGVPCTRLDRDFDPARWVAARTSHLPRMRRAA